MWQRICSLHILDCVKRLAMVDPPTKLNAITLSSQSSCSVLLGAASLACLQQAYLPYTHHHIFHILTSPLLDAWPWGFVTYFYPETPKEITYRQLSSDKRARKLSSAKVRHLSFCEVGIIRSVYFKQLVLHSLFIWSNFLSPVSYAAMIGSCLMLVSSPLMSNQSSPQLCPQSLWSLFNLSHLLRPAL